MESSDKSKGLKCLSAESNGPLIGHATIPGDKSISHRALILGSMALGETTLHGILDADDINSTAKALSCLGARIIKGSDGTVRVNGRGVGGLSEPNDVLDLGNAGTGARLLMGILATHDFISVINGDQSLRQRPMAHIVKPLEQMGAQIYTRDGGRLPATIIGTNNPIPISYHLPIPSAQLKSAIILAGLNTPGRTRVIEPTATRDHTEQLLLKFGANLQITVSEDEGRIIDLIGLTELKAQELFIPADPSSAAFPIVAALLVPGSKVTVRNVAYSPTRSGLFETLADMGATIEITRSENSTADITAEFSNLHGAKIPAERAPRMIDEYPILAIAAACAQGSTIMQGLSELKVKESNRLNSIAEGLNACGVETEILKDSLVVNGNGGPPSGGGVIHTHHDHRIAMSFLVLGLATPKPVAIDDSSVIATSFPGFMDMIAELGGSIGPK